MAAHRYWRLNIASNYGGANTTVVELELRFAVGGANQVNFGVGTAAASSFTGSSTASKAFDSSNATDWTSFAVAPPHSLEWDFSSSSGNWRDIVEIAIKNGPTSANNVQFATVEWSDGGAWTSIGYVINPDTADALTVLAPVPPGVGTATLTGPKQTLNASASPVEPHRYWRLNIASNHGASGTRVAELELRSTVGGANQTNVGVGTASASSAPDPTNNGADKAFDGSSGDTNWLSATAAPPHWLQWDFGASSGAWRDIVQIAIKNSSFASTGVQTATLSYSDNGSTFTSIGFVSNPSTVSTTTALTPVPPIVANGALTGPQGVVTGFGGASGAAAPPVGLLTAFFGATASLTNTSPKLTFLGGINIAVSPPIGFLTANGSEVLDTNGAALAAPSATLQAFFGATSALTAPLAVLGITGTFTNSGTALLQPPSPVLSATGSATGTSTAFLSNPIGSLIGYMGAVCTITLTDSPVLEASGTAGGIGGAQLTAPLFELVATGSDVDTGSAELIAPAPQLSAGVGNVAYLIAPGATLVAIGSATVALAYEAYAVNLQHKLRPGTNELPTDEVTRYTNFPFTRIVRYKNSYFGMAADGLYLLSGPTDYATPTPAAISFDVKTHIDDFGTAMKKTVAAAYFGGSLGPADTVTLHVGETAPLAYAFTTPRGAVIQNHRQKFGRGAKDRYFAVEMEGSGPLELDSVELEVNELSRRI